MRIAAVILALTPLAGCVAAAPGPAAQAQADNAAMCAACHGAGGRGDGELAASLPRRPADLTALALANGGVFPKVRAMSAIDGLLRTRHGGGGPMPEFGNLLASPLVLWDDGSGRPVPVPSRLLGLADFLETLQQR